MVPGATNHLQANGVAGKLVSMCMNSGDSIWKGVIRISLLATALLVNSADSHGSDPLSQWVLTDNRPTGFRNTAWAAGTGRMGALVYHRDALTRIELNHSEFWLGKTVELSRPTEPHTTTLPAEINKRLEAGDSEQALDIFRKSFEDQPAFPGIPLPACELSLQFPAMEGADEFTRELDMKNGILKASFTTGGNTFHQTIFFSPEENLMGIRIFSQTPRLLSGKVEFQTRMEDPKIGFTGDGYYYCRGSANDYSLPGTRIREKSELHFDARILPRLLKDGRMIITYKDIQFVEATEIVLFVSLKPNRADAGILTVEPSQWNERHLESWRSVPWDEALERHSKASRNRMERTELTIGPTPGIASSTLPKLFQAARYHAFSARMGNHLPMSGIWGPLPRPTPDTQLRLHKILMEFAALRRSNVPETWDPLKKLAARALHIQSPIPAALGFESGSNAVILPDPIDHWDSSLHNPALMDSLWLIGGAWVSHELWSAHNIHPDSEDLEYRIAPFMESTTRFILDFLFDEKTGNMKNLGWLRAGPEPAWDPDSNRLMNLQIVLQSLIDSRELIRSASSHISDSYEGLAPRIDSAIRSSTNHLIREAELIHAGSTIQPQALWGLYPGNLGNIDELDKLWHQLSHRSAPIAEDPLSLAWHGFISARSGNTEMALETFEKLGDHKFITMNLLDSNRAMTTLTGSLIHGLTLELLVQSGNGTIKLLPNLPESWKSGHLTGLRLPGQMSLDVIWDNNQLTQAAVKADVPTAAILKYDGRTSREIRLDAGASATLTGADFLPITTE